MAKNATQKAEESRERFLRLAPARVNSTLKQMSLVGNLARSGYISRPDERDKILSALRSGVAEVEAAFSNQRQRPKFSL